MGFSKVSPGVASLRVVRGVVVGVVAAVAFGGVVGEGVGTGVLFSRKPLEGVPAGEGSVGVDWLPHAAKKRRAIKESMGILGFNFRRCRQRYRMTGWILPRAPG